ncbi:MAG: hypothetical protein K2J08_08850 [Ruminococcus sp.]|nr:hypothetical protein [Ruminococcus sp.]
MISRISAEFETPELAETAIMRLRSSTNVRSVNMVYNKSAEKATRLQNGTMYTILPTAVTSYNYYTAVMESPASEDVVSEPERRRNTTVYIVCNEEDSGNVKSVLNAMGGLNVKVRQ